MSSSIPHTHIKPEFVCEIQLQQLNQSRDLATAYNNLIDFLLDEANPQDEYHRRFFKVNEGSEEGYIRYIKLVGEDDKSVILIIRGTDGYVVGFIIKSSDDEHQHYAVYLAKKGLPTGMSDVNLTSKDEPESSSKIKETRKEKVCRKLREDGFEGEYADLGFGDGYWEIEAAANTSRDKVEHSKVNLFEAFDGFFSSKPEAVAKSILFVAQFFMEAIRIKIIRDRIVTAYPDVTTLDEDVLIYQHGVSFASFLNRLHLAKQDISKLVFKVRDDKELALHEVNTLYGGHCVQGGTTIGRKTKRSINLKDEYEKSQKTRRPRFH